MDKIEKLIYSVKYLPAVLYFGSVGLIGYDIYCKIQKALFWYRIGMPVNSNFGLKGLLPVYVPLLPWLSALRAAWLVWTH